MAFDLSLANFDALGTIVGLRFKGNNRLRSKLGGFLTIFIAIVIITTVGFFFRVYLSGSEMSQINNIVKYWNSQVVDLTDKFQIAVMTKFGGNVKNQNEIWKIEAFYVENNLKSRSNNYTSLNIIPCEIDNWSSVSYQYNLLNLNEALCVDTSNITLLGNYNTEIFKYVKIQYILKVDLTNATLSAKSKTMVGNEMPVSTLFFLEGSYEINGKDSIISYFINSVNVNVTWSNIKDIEIFTSNDEIRKTLDRIIYNDNTVDNIFVINQANEKISVRPDLNTNSLSYRIMASNKKNILTVNFMTISEMFARIGGIVQNLLMVLFLINYLMTFWTYDLNKLNEVVYHLSNDYLLLDPRVKRDYIQSNEMNASKLEKSNVKLTLVNKINFIPNKSFNQRATSHRFLDINQTNVAQTEKNDPYQEFSENSDKIESQQSRLKLDMNNLEALNNKDNLNLKKVGPSDVDAQKNLGSNERKLIIESGQITPNSVKNVKAELNPFSLSVFGFLEMNESIKYLIDNKKKVLFNLSSFLCFRYLEFLGPCCYSKHKKYIYDFAEDYLNKVLEISNAEKNHLHLQLLKYLLFNETQMELFENLPVHYGNQILKKIDSISHKTVIDIKNISPPDQLAKLGCNYEKRLYGVYQLLNL